MTIYYAVLAAVALATLIIVAVHVLRTLTQVQSTLREVDDFIREAEALTRKANVEMDKVGSVTNAVSGLAGAVGGTGSRIAMGVANLVFQAIQRRRQRPIDAEEDASSPRRERSRT